METQEIPTQEPKVEAPRVSAEEVATVINRGVAEIRLKKSGVENPTAEQIKEEADKISNSLVGQNLEHVEARRQFNLDVAEWIGSVTGAE